MIAQEKLAIEKNTIITNKTKQSNEIVRLDLVIYFNGHPLLPDVIKEVSAAKSALYKIFQGDIKIRSQGKEYGKIEKLQKPDGDVPRYYEKSPKHPDCSSPIGVKKLIVRGISPSFNEWASCIRFVY